MKIIVGSREHQHGMERKNELIQVEKVVMPKKNKPAVPGYDGPRKTALESIRLFCISCMGGSFALVSDCPSTACAFHAYRSGARAGRISSAAQGHQESLRRLRPWW